MKRKKPSADPAPRPGNTITNYFKKREGPTPAPKKGPQNLFPTDERRNWDTIPWNKGTRSVIISAATPEGPLMAGCYKCTAKSWCHIEDFAPPECNRNARNRPRFFDALEEYNEAYDAKDVDAAREARQKVELYRVNKCPQCRESTGKLTPAIQACKDEWIRMRKEACAKHNGCQNQNCVERGEQAWCVLQADHVHTKNDEDEDKRKTHHLSDYKWWSWNGGVEAMRKEAANGVNWYCAFCHYLQPTGKQANKYEDPKTMPNGKPSGNKTATEEEVAQYKRKHAAKIVYPKQQYVDKRKRKIGECELCKRKVVPGQEHAFPFDHRDPSTKMIDDKKTGKKTLAGEKGGVAGLVANSTQEAARPHIDPILDNEMDLCRLLCLNCDRRHTFNYPMREPS